jgi:hypothetical protein
LKAAHVSYNTVKLHERNDPEFAAQLRQAEEEGAQLLHDVCFQAALEGNLEPVYWQGQIVGQIRKIDNRLRIEMLRAHMPKVFKTPGGKVEIVTGDGSQTIICGPEEMETMIASRQLALNRMKAEREQQRVDPTGLLTQTLPSLKAAS